MPFTTQTNIWPLTKHILLEHCWDSSFINWPSGTGRRTMGNGVRSFHFDRSTSTQDKTKNVSISIFIIPSTRKICPRCVCRNNIQWIMERSSKANLCRQLKSFGPLHVSHINFLTRLSFIQEKLQKEALRVYYLPYFPQTSLFPFSEKESHSNIHACESVLNAEKCEYEFFSSKQFLRTELFSTEKTFHSVTMNSRNYSEHKNYSNLVVITFQPWWSNKNPIIKTNFFHSPDSNLPEVYFTCRTKRSR